MCICAPCVLFLAQLGGQDYNHFQLWEDGVHCFLLLCSPACLLVVVLEFSCFLGKKREGSWGRQAGRQGFLEVEGLCSEGGGV